MAEVTLILKANASDHIAKMKQAQTETQKVYDIADKGGKREKGILEEIDATLSRLEKSKRKAFTYEDIEKYNKKIQETKQNLEEYEKAGIKANEKVKASGDTLMQSVGKWALGFASVATAVSLLKDAFQATEAGLRTFNVIGAITKQILYDLVTGSQINLSHILLSISANKELEKIRINERKEIVEIAKAQTIYNELYFAASDQTKSQAEQLTILNQAMIQYEVLMATKIAMAEEELGGIRMGLAAAPEKTALLDAEAAKLAEIETLKGEVAASTKRVEMRRTGIIKQARADEVKAQKDALDEQNKIIKQFFEDWERETEVDIKKRAELMNSETGMGKGIDEWFNQAMKEAEIDNTSREKRLKKASDEVDEFFKIWERETDIDNKKHEENDKVLAEMKAEALKKMGAAVLDYMKIVDELAQKEVDRTQRERELLDTQVSEAQSALNTEVELYKAGYASNVGAKKKELADLKVARDKALKDEELARKKQHTIELASLLAQKAVDLAKVISSTAVANAKAVAASPLTLGQPWVAINTVAAALSIAAIVAAVIAASTAKYAKGGWTGDGKYRDETGERVAGVVHENEFVIKRGQAGKYRPLLDAINRDDKRMIFNSFNRLRPELLGGTTNVFVENEGPNNRLDQLITENKKLNAKLSGESIQNFGNVQVIRKGNSVRTIR